MARGRHRGGKLLTETGDSGVTSDTMTILRNIPWPRILAEGAIIVAGILLALWVDAWWDDRQDRIEERAILIPLRAEAVQLLVDLAANRTRAAAILASTTTLANMSLQGATPDQVDEVDRHLRDFMWHVDASFTDAPVLESLFFTGDFELISNSDLRREIEEARVRLNRLRVEIERESDYYNRTVIPYLQQNAELAQLYTHESIEPGFPATPDTTYAYPGLTPSPLKSQVGLLNKREFQNILLHRLTTLINALWWWEHNQLEEGLRRLSSIIDREVEE
jgi:hypothetical protein